MNLGRSLAVAALMLAVGRSSVGAEPQVRFEGGRLDVRAQVTPLPELLDRIAKATGMKLTYDPRAQRPNVSVTRTSETPAQAVLGILEGLGLSYLVEFSERGDEVRTLMIVGSGTEKGPATPAPAAGPAFDRVPVEEVEIDEVVPPPSPAFIPAPTEAGPAFTPPGMSVPGMNVPGMNGAAPGSEPTGMRFGSSADAPVAAPLPAGPARPLAMPIPPEVATPEAGGGAPPVAVPRPFGKGGLPPGMRQGPPNVENPPAPNPQS